MWLFYILCRVDPTLREPRIVDGLYKPQTLKMSRYFRVKNVFFNFFITLVLFESQRGSSTKVGRIRVIGKVREASENTRKRGRLSFA